MSSGHKWKRLQRAVPKPPSEELIAAWVQEFGITREAAIAGIAEQLKDIELWRNDLYQVEVRRYAELIWLCIRRTDGYPGRDWRHFQQIKNEIVGPENEAVELYPAESRLVDSSNKYHLWCVIDHRPFASRSDMSGATFGTTRDMCAGSVSARRCSLRRDEQ